MRLAIIMALAPILLQGSPATLSYQTVPAVSIPQLAVIGSVPGQSIEFFDGVAPLGAAIVNSAGNATFNVSSLTPGTHVVSARVRGTGASIGQPMQIPVAAAVSDQFAAATAYALGIQPLVFAAGAPDQHGNSLLAAAGNGTLSVLFASGGVAAPPVALPGVSQPVAIAIADLNGDGSNDIVVVSATGSITIYLNNGSGSFSSSHAYQAGGHASGVAIADFNSDGVPDLVLANETGQSVSYLAGRNDGTFASPVSFPAGVGANAIAVGDFNGDGFPDVAVTGYATNNVAVLLGDGNGGFQATSPSATGNGPAALVAGDFNEDGTVDLAVLNNLDHTITILVNNGSAMFQIGATLQGAASFTAGHVSGTTHMDVLAQTGNGLQLYAGSGNGTFTPSTALTVSAAPQTLLLDDFTGAGFPNIVAAELSGTLSVYTAAPVAATPASTHANLRQSSSQLFSTQTAQTSGSQTLATSTVFLASSNTSSNLGASVTLTATVSPAAATGTVTFYDGDTILEMRALLNGQAILTTALLPSGANSLTARYSGNATYSGSVSSAVAQTVTVQPQSGLLSSRSNGAGASPHAVVTADFNGDGIPDFAITNSAAASASGVSVFLGSGNGSFAAGVSYNGGSQPFGLVAVDVNGDGSTDLVVTNAGSAQVTVLINAGNGTFTTGSTFATGNSPQAIVAGDFNNDGVADLAVANLADGTVSILLGQGAGIFGAAVPYTVGTSPTSLAVADFNADGSADLVVTNSGSSNISVLFGIGDGTFQAATSYAAGSQPYWVVTADLNGDGYPDIAVANALTGTGNVGVLLNKGVAQPGVFFARVPYNAGNTPHYIATGDFNSDGIPDLFVVNKGTSAANSTFSILYGQGAGTFQAPATVAVGNLPWSAAISDFNLDGRTDVAIASSADNKVYVLLGNGLYPDLNVTSSHSASFVQGKGGATYTLTASNIGVYQTSGIVSVTDTLPAGLTATAMAGDGWTCNVPTLTCTTTAVVIPGASFTPITLTVSVAGTAPLTVTNSVTVSGGGEINVSNDSATDPTTVIQTTTLALVSSTNPSTSGTHAVFTATVSASAATGSVVFYDGASPFQTVSVSAGQAVVDTSLLTAGTHLITARYSGDTQYGASTSSVVPQVVNTQLQNGFAAGINYGVGVTNPSGIVMADFNGDGIPDLAVSNSSSTSKVTILIGNGDGTFKTAVNYTAGGASSAPFAIIAADFNGDGFMDVAVANSGSNNLSVLIGNGDGSFKSAVNTPVGAGSHPQFLAAGDFNQDGIPDLAVAANGTGIVSIFLGNGDGTFQAAPTHTVGAGPRSLVLRDFNGDGFTDIAVANYTSNTVSVLLGDGTGNFISGATYSVGTNPQSVATGDFNGDGIADLAVANNGSNTVTMLLGTGTGTFNIAGSFPAGITTGVVVNDFNGDGIADLAVADSGGGVSLLLGVGDGTMQAPLNYNAGTTPSALVTGDFNGDGLSDLAVANQGSSNLTVLLGGLFYSDVTIASSHADPFTQGQSGAQYTLTVTNAGQYPTAGKVTVTDTLPAGLTATAIFGPNWTCTLANLTCTRADALVPASSYPVITIVANVSRQAASQVTNTAHVAGGNETNVANDTATDPTTILQLTTLNLVPSASPWVYNAAENLVATVSQSTATGTITFYQGQTVIGTGTVSNGVASIGAPALTPGSYQFSAVYSGDSLDTGSTGQLSVTVDKATATVTLSGLSATWTGSPVVASATTNPTGLNVSITYNGSSTAPSDAGTYTVVATVNDANYGGSASGSLVISPVQATVTLTIPSGTYDGNPHTATASTSPSGLTVSITYSSSQTAPVNAGTYIVAATITTPNYIGSASGTLVISAAPVTLTLSGLSAVYNGSPVAASVTTDPPGVPVTVTYNGKGAAPTAAGNYNVVALPVGSNYSGSATGTLVISPAAVSFTFGSLLATYDGLQKAVPVTSAPSGIAYSITYNGTAQAPTIAGAYNVVVTSANTNYAGTTSGTFVIQKATPVIAWAQPPAIAFGTPLSAGQLNASTATPGTFTYAPGIGTVLTAGSQPLTVTFMPLDSNDYNVVTANNTITVNPGTANGVSIVASKILSRDANNNIQVAVTFANTGTSSADNVNVATLKIGATTGGPLPVNLGTIPAGTTTQYTFVVPASAGASGTISTWTVGGTFTVGGLAGSFSTGGKISLP